MDDMPSLPTPILDTIASPADLRQLSVAELVQLADEVRAELLAVISKSGGHLASNLGVVELTIALLRVFDPTVDKLIWDTSHQAYVYKLLTGRRALFQSLRQDDGCSGFLSRDESPFDHFGAGHAGTAISAALGFAVARDNQGGHEKVVAVVGDGAIGNGISLEGINNVVGATRDVILVLNDNKMSIAPNVGALASHLNKIISGRTYNRFKAFTAATIDRIPGIGRPLRRWIRRVEEAVKSVLVPGGLFEAFGLRYIGPIDGHNLGELIETFERVSSLRERLLVHVLTEKGHGYPFAAKDPEIFHGLNKFDTLSGQPITPAAETPPSGPTFTESFGDKLAQMMEADPRLLAITAGMCKNTGLDQARDHFPNRYFDVGIAEEHAVVFAAGLAAAGQRPVVAIYATFMQRAVDCVLHDICLQNLPVILCLDRAGIVADGPTHHGIHDLAFWRGMPNLLLAQPADHDELVAMLEAAHAAGTPAIIRYPKGEADNLPVASRPRLQFGRAARLRDGTDVAIWCLGRETLLGLQVAEQLAKQGLQARVVNTRFVQPFDHQQLRQDAGQMPVVTLEDHCLVGGLATVAAESLNGMFGARLLSCGWPAATVVPHGSDNGIRRKYGLSVDQVAARVADFVGQAKPATAGN